MNTLLRLSFLCLILLVVNWPHQHVAAESEFGLTNVSKKAEENYRIRLRATRRDVITVENPLVHRRLKGGKGGMGSKGGKGKGGKGGMSSKGGKGKGGMSSKGGKGKGGKGGMSSKGGKGKGGMSGKGKGGMSGKGKGGMSSKGGKGKGGMSSKGGKGKGGKGGTGSADGASGKGGKGKGGKGMSGKGGKGMSGKGSKGGASGKGGQGGSDDTGGGANDSLTRFGKFLYVSLGGDTIGQYVLKLDIDDGSILYEYEIGTGGSLSPDPTTGAVWTPNRDDPLRIDDQLVQINFRGTTRKRLNGYRTDTLAVDPRNGDLWVGLPNEDVVIKLDEMTDEEVVRVEDFSAPWAMQVDPNDGSLWVADSDRTIRKLQSDGSLLFSAPVGGFFSNAPLQVAIDPNDGSVWHVDTATDSVLKRSSSGEVLFVVDGFDRPVAISVDPQNGSAWICSLFGRELVKVTSMGETSLRISFDYQPIAVAVHPTDSSVWVGLLDNSELLHLDENGNGLSSLVITFQTNSISTLVAVNS